MSWARSSCRARGAPVAAESYQEDEVIPNHRGRKGNATPITGLRKDPPALLYWKVWSAKHTRVDLQMENALSPQAAQERWDGLGMTTGHKVQTSGILLSQLLCSDHGQTYAGSSSPCSPSWAPCPLDPPWLCKPVCHTRAEERLIVPHLEPTSPHCERQGQQHGPWACPVPALASPAAHQEGKEP